MAAPAPIITPRRQGQVAVSNGSNRISNFLDATTTPGTQKTADLVVTQTHQATSTIAAGEIKRLNFAGISYYFGFIGTAAGVITTDQLTVRPINRGQPRPEIIHVQGTGLRFGTQPFIALEVINNTANTVQFTLDIGGGIPNNSYDEFIDNRVSIVGAAGGGSTSINVTTAAGVSLATANAPTTNLAFKTRNGAWGDSLLAGAQQSVDGNGIVGKRRYSITFSNDDAVAVLQVLDATGNIFATIQPSTAWLQVSSDTFILKNPSGGAVTCHIGEVYYS